MPVNEVGRRINESDSRTIVQANNEQTFVHFSVSMVWLKLYPRCSPNDNGIFRTNLF